MVGMRLCVFMVLVCGACSLLRLLGLFVGSVVSYCFVGVVCFGACVARMGLGLVDLCLGWLLGLSCRFVLFLVFLWRWFGLGNLFPVGGGLVFIVCGCC